MTKIWDIEGSGVVSLSEVVAHLDAAGRSLFNEDLDYTASLLRGLCEDRSILPDLLRRQLAGENIVDNRYSAQVFVLGRGEYFTLRAVIWDEPVGLLGEQMYLYELPHDHDFSFFTLGYFGPGYETVVRSYDNENVVGVEGESVRTYDEERWTLSKGRVALFEGGKDIHCQLPPASLSISFNVLQNVASSGIRRRQYEFDENFSSVRRVLNVNPVSLLARAACAVGGAAVQYVEEIAITAPGDYERAVALKALVSLDPKYISIAMDDRSPYVRAEALPKGMSDK